MAAKISASKSSKSSTTVEPSFTASERQQLAAYSAWETRRRNAQKKGGKSKSRRS